MFAGHPSVLKEGVQAPGNRSRCAAINITSTMIDRLIALT